MKVQTTLFAFKKVTHCYNFVMVAVAKLQLEILFVNIKAAIEQPEFKIKLTPKITFKSLKSS